MANSANQLISFCQKEWDGCALLGQPSKGYWCRISILFPQCSTTLLAPHIKKLETYFTLLYFWTFAVWPDVSHPKFQNCSLVDLNNIFWFSCPDSEETIAVTEINNSSYESPNTQLLGVGSTRTWNYHGGNTLTFGKKVNFLRKLGRGTPKWCHTLFCLPIKIPNTSSKGSCKWV